VLVGVPSVLHLWQGRGWLGGVVLAAVDVPSIGQSLLLSGGDVAVEMVEADVIIVC